MTSTCGIKEETGLSLGSQSGEGGFSGKCGNCCKSLPRKTERVTQIVTKCPKRPARDIYTGGNKYELSPPHQESAVAGSSLSRTGNAGLQMPEVENALERGILEENENQREEPRYVIGVTEAIETVFRIPSLHSGNNADDAESSDFYLCNDCADVLTSLYEAFEEFQKLTDQASFVSRRLRALEEHASGTAHSEIFNPKSRKGRKKQAVKPELEASRSKRERRKGSNDTLQEKVEISDFMENSKQSDQFDEAEAISAGRREIVTESGQKRRTSTRTRRVRTPSDLGEIPRLSTSKGGLKSKNSLPKSENAPSILDSILLEISPENGFYTEDNLETTPDGRYFCPAPTCGKAFKGIKTLNRHALSHKVDKPYKCSKSRQEIEEHINQNHFKKSPTLLPRSENKRSLPKLLQKRKNVAQIRKKYNKLKTHQDKLKCDQCDLEFLTKLRLRKHLLSHHHKEPAKSRCTVCDRTFASVASLARHISDAHEKKLMEYECPECGVSHQNYESLQAHFEESHKEPLHLCKACGKSFVSGSHLRRHFKQAHDIQPPEVNKSEEGAVDEFMLSQGSEPGERVRKQSDGGQTSFKCGECGKEFKRKKQLSAHVLFHNETEPRFGCSQCPKRFFQPRALRKHMLLHELETSHPCSDCGKVFARSDHLKRHKEVIHATNRQKAVRKAKVRKKTTVVEHRCFDCDKTFTRREYLRLHMRIHTGEKPFMCSVCGKTFRDPRNLAQHLVTHKSERPFCCSVCGLTFKRAHHLNDHEGTHRADVARPFLCSIPGCGKAFKLRKHLVSHELVHTGSRDHACHVCGKAFNRKDNLRQHINKVHGKDLASHLLMITQQQLAAKTATSSPPQTQLSLKNPLADATTEFKIEQPIISCEAPTNTVLLTTTAPGAPDSGQITEVLHIIPSDAVTTLAAIPSASIIHALTPKFDIAQFTYTHQL